MQELLKVEESFPHYYGDLMIQEILPKEMFTLMKKNRVAIIDIRDERSYFYGHIPGAIHMFIDDIHKPENQEIFRKNKRIIIYCYIGIDSLEAIETIIDMGYDPDKFLNLKGGIARWNTEGFIVVNTPSEIKLDV